ncbi:MAG: glycosyltransferase family 4 protein [Bacteroidales bacterium]
MSYKLTLLFRLGKSYQTLGNASRLNMAKYLAAKFDSTILTNQAESIQNMFPDQKIISIKSSIKGKVPLFNEYRYWKYLAKKINSIPADGVFIFLDAPVAIWIRKPVFQYIHQYGKRNVSDNSPIIEFFKSQIQQIKHRYFLKGFKKSSQNFVVSSFLMDYFKNEGLENLELTPHAIELSKFQNPLINDKHKKLSDLRNKGWFIMSYTGWVTENRGFQLMMDTIKKIAKHNSNVMLVIAGADSNFSNRISDYQEKYQLQNNIINYGIVDVSIIPGILHYSNVALSFWEADVPGFQLAPPQKIFEYFAAGLPVICNKVQTHSMFVENKKTGFVLDMDSTAVADAVLELINNKELYRQMCTNVSNEAKKYDMDVVYHKMVEIINEKINELQILP